MVDDPGLPIVVACGRETRLGLQPLEGAKQGLVLPVPDVVALPVKDDCLGQRALERLIDVVLLRRWPRESAGAALVVGEDPVDAVPALRAALGIDADRPGGVALPGEVAVGKPGISGAVAKPALEDADGLVEVLRVAQVEVGGHARKPAVCAPIIGAVLVADDEVGQMG